MNTRIAPQDCHLTLNPHPTAADQFSLNNSTETSQSINTPQQTFHPFPRLPSELRDAIWTYALPGPRLIEVYAERSLCITADCRGSCSHPKVGQFFAANPLRHALLQASKESRRAVFRAQEYCFTITSTHESPPHTEKIYSPGVAFRPNLDAIYFRTENQPLLTNILLDAQLLSVKTSNIKSFAVDDWDTTPYRRGGPENLFPFLLQGSQPMLSGLEEFFFMRLEPWREEDTNEKWISYVKKYLKDIKSPLDPDVKILKKSKLWDGEGGIPWVAGPHWMSRAVAIQAKENAIKRFEVLGERANLPLSSLQ